MTGVIRVKPGVEFAVIAPGGFRILWALETIAYLGDYDITITSGTDGVHSGVNDPHHRGEAYDIRTHDLSDKEHTLSLIKGTLGPAFYAFIEDPGTDNEHIHCQVARGQTYPPQDTVSNHDAVQSAAQGED
jgi:hypothetical protein